MLRGGIAERGGVRVGHRIIEINGQSVVAVPHERIVNLLATSIGEVMFSYTGFKHLLEMFSLGIYGALKKYLNGSAFSKY